MSKMQKGTTCPLSGGRPQPTEKDIRDKVREREQNTARVRRYRRRRALGLAMAPVEVDAEIIDLLVRLRWLRDEEAGDMEAVGKAIAVGLAETAARKA